jgi:C-terminal processing protease CtpA/Prc
MKNLSFFSLIFLLVITMWGCSDDSNSTGPDPGNETNQATSEKQFVYNAMNEWYLYQTDVANLADNRFASDEELQQFLMTFSDAEALFGELQIQNDPYSFFIEDYEEFENNQDGIQAALGFDYSFVQLQDESIIGYVRYIIPDSPAEDAGLERGDIFTQVDGNELTVSNLGILRTNSSHTLTLAEVDGDQIVETGEVVTVESRQVIEDPIFLTKTFDVDGGQVGYMIYNAFQSNSHRDLNDAFANFQGVDELVIDLRYNGGGAVITSQLLASLISGLDDSNTFSEFQYNDKKSQFNDSDPFLEAVPLPNDEGRFELDEDGNYVRTIPMNNLSLDHVYVITSLATASASEALINGLKPFIDVTLVGSTTEGKDVGSITLYDAPPNYSDKDNINPNHKKAIQPIVVSIRNANDENYPNGFTPAGNNIVREVNNLGNLPPLGSMEDPLLARALALISGETIAKDGIEQAPAMLRGAKILGGRKDFQPYGNGMYIEPFMMLKSTEN